MHRAVLGPRPKPTGGHEPGPIKQARNGPLTGTKRPESNPTVTTRLPIPRPRATNPYLASSAHGLHEAHLGLALGVLHFCPANNPKTRAAAKSQLPTSRSSSCRPPPRSSASSACPAGRHCHCHLTPPATVRASSASSARPRSRRPAPLPPYPAGRRHGAQRSRPPRRPRAAEPPIGRLPPRHPNSGSRAKFFLHQCSRVGLSGSRHSSNRVSGPNVYFGPLLFSGRPFKARHV
jgi:hypothetical protein